MLLFFNKFLPIEITLENNKAIKINVFNKNQLTIESPISCR